MSVQNLVIAQINPTQKDLDRVNEFDFYKSGMRNWFYGNGSPIESIAAKQAKLIKDPEKLVRRAKATVARWGTQPHHGYAAGQPKEEWPWRAFKTRLQEMGFTNGQIQEIASFRNN